MPIEHRPCPVRAVTCGPHAHFFGYYDKPPWDAAGRYMLALEARAVDRMPLPGETATVGLVDLRDGNRFEPLAQTTAWNWQQGCMLQWLPPACDRQIIYNDAVDGQHVAVILDIHTGARRILPRPIYNLTRDGRHAVSKSLARLAHTRPVVGYAGVVDPHADELAPAGDGIWAMDLQTGQSRLIVSLAQVAAFRPVESMAGVKHRFEHLVAAPDGRRLFFMHRWPMQTTARRNYWDRLFTVGLDGSDMHLLADDGMVSHFDWRDGRHILAWARHKDRGDHFYLFEDRTPNVQIVGEDVLTSDGHCSYSPDRRWILGDSYPDADLHKSLWVYEIAANRRIDIGRFATPPALRHGDIRCDLHPRWNRDGTQVCTDSAHEGPRQMYVVDISAVVR